jgi:hypothetical protein
MIAPERATTSGPGFASRSREAFQINPGPDTRKMAERIDQTG